MRVASLSPRAILAIGWLGLMLYAYPGFMSYDSVFQLEQARNGVFSDGHPPMMGALWSITDSIIAGPLGMLVIQSTCFLVGMYLLLRRCMSDRFAAACALLLLWFPPVSAVMAVIWKDSQMAAFLVLGAALLLSPRRRMRVVGLAFLLAATAMRYNALAITLPLVLLLFTWSASHRWWQRYPLATVAWLGITLSARFVNTQLTSEGGRLYPWHDGLALLDIVGTLRYAPEVPDEQLGHILAGTPLIATHEFQHTARRSHPPEDIDPRKLSTFGTGTYVPALWVTTFHVFGETTTMAERAAISRAWRGIILAHPTAYLEYRWNVLRERIHLGDDEIPSGAYVWFTDVLDIGGSARKLGHAAAPSGLQKRLREAMLWLGTSWLFRPYVYVVLALALLGLSLRHRAILALVLSGLANEAALFILAPTIDYRYSFWLVVATLVAMVMLIGARARRATAA